MKTEELQKLHRVELDILRELIRVCELLHIPYFAVYGTAIGAIRHQGFIPWDDDIDIGMLRKDFTIFMEKAPELLAEGFTLQYRKTDPNYFILHAKLRKDNTTFLEQGYEKVTGHQGIFVDIFPFDYLPESKLARRYFCLKRKIYQNLLSLDYEQNYWKLPGWKNKIRAIIKAISKRIFPDKMTIAKRFDALLESLPESRYICEQEVRRCFYLTDWFKGIKKVKFENIDINIMEGYHDYLTTFYGDYMTPPPVEQQVPRHFHGIIDTEKPYTYYTENNLNKH